MTRKIPIYTPFEVIDVLNRESDDEHLWWYITALRGCDVPDGGGDIKRIFTCPLRGDTEVAWDISYCTFSDLPDVSMLDEDQYQHYMCHVSNGYRALGEYFSQKAQLHLSDDKILTYYISRADDIANICDELDRGFIESARDLILKFVQKVTNASNGIYD